MRVGGDAAGIAPGGAVPEVRFEATEPVTLVGANERRAAGLEFWVDGTMGIHRPGDGRTLVVAPNGPALARHDLSHGGFIRGLLAARQPIEGLPPDVDHASGGPLHHDPDSGALLLVYHGETFRGGDPRDYYSFLGMAVSHDEGATFRDLGRIVTSWLEEHDPARPRPVDVGPGALVVRDGWFHVYFQDRGLLHSRRDLSVARAPVAEVLAAAREGRAPEFRKHFDGRWDEPGLGGRSDELLPMVHRRVVWFDVADAPSLGARVLVHSAVQEVSDGIARWNHGISVSGDGLRWTTPQWLHPEPVPAEVLYVTIDSGGPVQRRIDGDRFDLYRVRSSAADRWRDARLERVTVHLRRP